MISETTENWNRPPGNGSHPPAAWVPPAKKKRGRPPGSKTTHEHSLDIPYKKEPFPLEALGHTCYVLLQMMITSAFSKIKMHREISKQEWETIKYFLNLQPAMLRDRAFKKTVSLVFKGGHAKIIPTEKTEQESIAESLQKTPPKRGRPFKDRSDENPPDSLPEMDPALLNQLLEAGVGLKEDGENAPEDEDGDS